MEPLARALSSTHGLMALPACPAATNCPSCLPLPPSPGWGSLAGVQQTGPHPCQHAAHPRASSLLSPTASAFAHSVVIARGRQCGAEWVSSLTSARLPWAWSCPSVPRPCEGGCAGLRQGALCWQVDTLCRREQLWAAAARQCQLSRLSCLAAPGLVLRAVWGAVPHRAPCPCARALAVTCFPAARP